MLLPILQMEGEVVQYGGNIQDVSSASYDSNQEGIIELKNVRLHTNGIEQATKT